MKNKNLILTLVVIAGGVYLWRRHKESQRTASLAGDEHSNCSGCNGGFSNVKGTYGGGTCNFYSGSERVAIDCNGTTMWNQEPWTAQCSPDGSCTATSASGMAIHGSSGAPEVRRRR